MTKAVSMSTGRLTLSGLIPIVSRRAFSSSFLFLRGIACNVTDWSRFFRANSAVPTAAVQAPSFLGSGLRMGQIGMALDLAHRQHPLPRQFPQAGVLDDCRDVLGAERVGQTTELFRRKGQTCPRAVKVLGVGREPQDAHSCRDHDAQVRLAETYVGLEAAHVEGDTCVDGGLVRVDMVGEIDMDI